MRRLGVLAVAWLLLGGEPADAAKFIQANIEVDGKSRFRASLGVPDTEEPADTWKRLGQIGFEAVGAAGPNEVTLEGDVRVVVVWVKTTVAEAKVDRLRLEQGPAGRWFLSADEVVRTGRAAGLDMSDRRWMAWAAVGGLVAVAAVAVWLFLRGRRAEAEPS